MVSVIDHSCYTFMREILVWKTMKNGKTTYLASSEISDERRYKETGVFMVLYPQHPGVKSKQSGFKPIEEPDLTLTDDAFEIYSRLKNDAVGKPEDFLNIILLKKLESLDPIAIPKFLTGQMELFNNRGGEFSTFYRYTKMLIENQNKPWTIKYTTWLKNNELEKEKEQNPRKNALSARQLILALNIMEKTRRINLPSTDKRVKAKFLEFLSGIGSENIEDQLIKLGDFSFTDFNTQSKKTFLRKDLEKVREKFQELGFFVEVQLSDEALLKLKAVKLAG
ncbi:MAG: hypothetical protein ACOYNC_05215 [Bacteroidales bacterium]